MPTLERRVADLERELQSLRAWTRSGAGSSTYGGATTTRPLQVGFPAKITSTYSAATGYNWSMRLLTPGTATTVDPTATVSGNGAVEVSGRTDIASGTKVWMEPDPNGRGFLFTVSDTGGVLTVKEVDGAPSISNVTEFRFDQTDGFVVSNPAAGVARVDMASASSTQAGVVDTATQTFGGVKTFQDDAYFQGTTGTGRIGTVNSISASSSIEAYDSLIGQSVYCYPASTGIWRHVLNDNLDDGSGDWALAVNSDAAYADTTDRTVTLFGGTSGTHPGELEINGVIQFAGISDANAPNSSLYYSTTANKLVYKDGGGTVQALW